MSLSSRSSGSGSRAGSPEDENGKPRPESPALSAAMKQDRFADLKRRSAQAFSVFANEEKDIIMKTHPDLPMGLVTRMMVEKWRSLSNEARKPYFDASRTTPARAKKATEEFVPGIVPIKKSRIATPSTSSGVVIPANEQVLCMEGSSEQPERVIIVQGRVSAPTVEIPKTSNPSVISASIAQALGVAVTPHRTTSLQITKNGMLPQVRTVPLRPKPNSTALNAQESSTVAMSFSSSSGDAHKRSINSSYGFTSSQQALDMFYLALCEPAFPHPNEPPLTPYPANYCYDAYLRMTSGNNGVM